MNTIARDDALMADTRHARLMRDGLTSGVFREWRFEHILEALVQLRQIEPSTEAKARQRFGQNKKLITAALDLMLRYAEDMPDAEQDKFYDLAERLLKRRRERLMNQAIEKEVASVS